VRRACRRAVSRGTTYFCEYLEQNMLVTVRTTSVPSVGAVAVGSSR